VTLAPAPDLDLEPWPVWLAAILPDYCTAPFAEHHVAFWRWVWDIEPGERPEAFVGIWARGGAKSTSAEAACVALGARRKRRYGLYVCDTQDRADDHVGNVAAMLESPRMELFYPGLASRQVGKYGNSRGWRRNRLWTRAGFVLDAIGLDSAARGVKLEDQRPDLFVIDDVDGLHDTAAATARKVETLTHSVIPAGASDAAILAIQNLVKRDGVFDQMATGRAEFLRRRILSGPIPAVEGLEVVRGDDGLDRVTAGEATWEGQSLQTVEEQINDWGHPAFLREAQHEVADSPGALWSQAQIDASKVDRDAEVECEQIIVSVDPSGGAGPGHDEQGIIAVGRGLDSHGYVLADWTCSLSPMGWGKRAVELAITLDADAIIVEGNYGGAMTGSTVQQAAEALAREGRTEAGRYTGAAVALIGASASKEERARGCAARYEEKERPETWAAATMHHVGDFPELEREMVTWEPDVTRQSPNRVDALAHAVKRLGIQRRRLRFRP
jgi:hypothetical protein